MASTAIPSWNVPYSRSDRWLLRFLPSLTDLALLLPAFLILFLLPEHLSGLLSDGDTGWHIRTGEWILQHHAVPQVDIFSFTAAGKPWFAWEWGWDVVFATVHRYTGLAGVAFVNLAILCLVSVSLYRLVRRACDHELIAMLVTTLALTASGIHWLARPHLLSWIFFLGLLHILARAQSGDLRLLPWTPALFLVWVNFHGSFFLGLLMLALFAFAQAVTQLLTAQPDFRAAWHSSKRFWLYTLLCSLATLVNPYTWHEHEHIVRYMQNASILDRIGEFQSPSFHGHAELFYESLLLLGIAAAFSCFRDKRWFEGLAVLFWAHFSLVAVRNIPLFVFVASPIIARLAVSLLSRDQAYPPFARRISDALTSTVQKLRPFELVGRYHVVPVALFLYFAFSIAANRPGYEVQLPKHFPLQALSVLDKHRPQRVFAIDQWSDFFIYHYAPDTKVFFDGRSDLYGPEWMDNTINLLNVRWDWKSYLDRYAVDAVVVEPAAPLATMLKMTAGWRLLLDDGSVNVFVRNIPSPSSTTKTAQQPIRVSTVVHNGERQLGAVSVCKYRTTTYERRCTL